ncbi:phospholipase D-like domain-containing protein [Tenggerimyces flavus]|uniref:Phosphatidylserine/phosphatidylglycerophosphate/ cardiolipin synthase family protein n=1 Tax=Tenggerimyces flavus TaxID=1708749 RepID=A0ABV7Y916_9ACTN|nr:phosphatidylserine/phosphatidylglycerophosphate/cardiolipin synthase family protein [Tenggerimyces flavus]MBM7786574.1 phosphatidylserine/phosphatidylglycerophosphate/cardiolipin synthase-like enzyme [Tenggerimyces flavus]
MFVASGSYPVREGNLVRPLVDGIPAFGRICAAVDAAEHRVWVTVCFLWDSFRLPDGRTFHELLGSAVDRGVDVRVLAWLPGDSTENVLEPAAARVPTRWDRAHPGMAQHQKSWLVDDAGFVGGMNLNPHTVVSPDHRGQDQYHDVYVEITGPATYDIAHNFVQRWNGATEHEPGDLQLPDAVPSPAGTIPVQIQRTLPPERSIFDQYVRAFADARRSIYLENQFLEDPEIVGCLEAALARGVEVVAVLPGEPPRTRHGPDFLDRRGALGDHPNFHLAGLAGVGADGQRKHVYVHSKVMLVDDAWATIGSANFHAGGMYGSAEMNASFHDPETVRALRHQLFAEHLGESMKNDVNALRLFGQRAQENRRRWDTGDHDWQGLAFALDPRTYGR